MANDDSDAVQQTDLYARIGGLLTIAADAIIAIDARHRITMFNEGAERIFGYSKAEIMGKPLDTLMPERFRRTHGRHISTLELDDKASRLMGERGEITGLRKDGSEFPAEASIAMVAGKGAKSFLAVLRDITVRKDAEAILAGQARELEQRVKQRTAALEAEIVRREEAQAQLVQSQRMEAFGQLTGGVAHDFNNLLTIISGNLELLEPELSTDKSRTHLKRALEAGEMASRLTSRLLTFARRRRLEPRIVDLNELMLGMAEILQRTIGSHILLSTILSPELWLTRADPSEIENAVLNLVINSRDAMPKGGRIVIETRNARFSKDDELAVESMRQGEYVVVSVTDTGMGMPPEVAARVFEPFFTTKPTGRGTGLGLSTIYGFAEQTGGHVTLYSEIGKGTTVSLYLPHSVEDEKLSSLTAQNTEDVICSENNETILVVEDNAEVREVTLQRIEALGYVVLEAGNGPQAIAMISKHPEIAVVFSDVIMPGGMSGYDLAQWVSAHMPGLPIILASGFTATSSADEHPAVVKAVLHKPYSRADLSRVLHEAISASPSES